MKNKLILFIFSCLINMSLFNINTNACIINSTPTGGINRVCVGNTLTLTVGAGSGSESWNSSSAAATVTYTSGTGSATVSGVSSGTATISYLISGVVMCTYAITINPVPSTPSISGAASICNSGGTVTLTGSPSGGGWTSLNLSIATVGSASGVVTGVSAGNANIKYTVRNTFNCTAFATVTETVDPTPSGGTISGNQVLWATTGSSGTCTLTTSGTPGLWSSIPSAIASIGSTSGVVRGNSAGTATVTYTPNSNSCGSGSVSTVVVTVNPLPYPPDAPPLVRATVNSVTGINTAAIFSNYSGGGNDYIEGIVYWDAGTPAYALYVSSYPHNASPVTSFTGTPNNTPDIAFGNVAGSSSSYDYLAAVAYPTSNNVTIDIFDVYFDGTTCSVNPTPVTTYSCSGTPNTVHIDGITDYGNLIGPLSLPQCRWAIVTWDDGGKVYAAELDMQGGGGALTAKLIDNGKDPDVAAIKRYVSSSIHDVALLAYTDGTNGTLYYNEWDVTSNTLLSAETFDAMGAGSSVSIPRIDAMDDTSVNDPTSGYAVYKVVAQVYNNSTGHYETRSYDNTMYGASPSYWTPTSIISVDYSPYFTAPVYDHYTPTVAIAGYQPAASGFPTLYAIQQFTEFVYSGNTEDVLFVIPMNYTISNAPAPPVPIAHGYYYWASDNSPSSTSGNYSNAIGTTVNEPTGSATISAWAYPDGSGNTNIEYYLTPSALVGDFDYKHSATQNTSALPKAEWKVYPNPASDELTITYDSKKGMGNYQITDLFGRSLLKGDVDGVAIANLSGLSSGNYILTLYSADGSHCAKMFVKE